MQEETLEFGNLFNVSSYFTGYITLNFTRLFLLYFLVE